MLRVDVRGPTNTILQEATAACPNEIPGRIPGTSHRLLTATRTWSRRATTPSVTFQAVERHVFDVVCQRLQNAN